MPDDALPAILAYIVSEWQRLRPITDKPPPRGVWIMAHEPVPAETVHGISTPVTNAWYGNAQGVHERDVDSVQHLRTNADTWLGRPYHRWGWVDVAPLVDEPVYYLEFVWGDLYAYGLQAVVTARGLVLTSSHLWRA
jgi:hypothetical protein